MWKLIRKWWFLQRLEYQIRFHTGKQKPEDIIQGLNILSTKEFFIQGTATYPGLARRPLGRYLSWLLFWRWFESEERYNRRVHDYMSFLKFWEEKGCISIAPLLIEVNQNGQISKAAADVPSLTTQADNYHGIAGLLELIQEKYPLTWVSTGKLLAFVIGSLGGVAALAWGILEMVKSLFHSW